MSKLDIILDIQPVELDITHLKDLEIKLTDLAILE
jgi:hypothetical protein